MRLGERLASRPFVRMGRKFVRFLHRRAVVAGPRPFTAVRSADMPRRVFVFGTIGLALVGAVACAKNGPDLSAHDRADDGGGLHPDGTIPGTDSNPIDLEAGPSYAVLGLSPSHGPFAGGTRVEIRGRGFSSHTKVRFGAIDLPDADVIASDPFHLQVTSPPNEVGPVDVQVSDTEKPYKAVLASGFTYDDYFVDPNVGATSGGTHLSFVGSGTKWVDGTKVTIDGKDCGALVVDDATHMHCLAPAGTPGTKSATVTTPDLVVDTVRDAYTYADTTDGYRGGLAGAALPGELDVLALAYPNGDLVPEATVVVLGADGTIQTQKTSSSGIATFPAPPAAPVTVTVSKKCLSPTTFAGVKVRSVTAYLNPVASVACIPPDGVPPPTGGKTREGGIIDGEIVFGNGLEFTRGGWKGVPLPKSPGERQAAYVFPAAGDNLSRFNLPDASQAILPDSPGTVGYAFSIVTLPGNITLYAMAGIETRPDGGTPAFEPYVFGVVRGIGVAVDTRVERVLIPMSGTFTHSVTLHVDGAPQTSRGPDRLHTTLAVDLGAGYMTLPYGTRDDLLPIGSDYSFVGMPPLSGPIGTASYVVAVEDVNGGGGSPPLSSILRYRSRDDAKPIAPAPFLPIPVITSPRADAPWDGRTVSISLPPSTADLIEVGVGAADGSTGWTVIAPGDARTIVLPDFSAHPELGLPAGSLTLGFLAAKLPAGFEYQRLRYGQLSKSAWVSYAYDTAFGFW